MAKQYFITCTETRIKTNGETYEKTGAWGYCSTIKTAKAMIKRHRKDYAQYNPHNYKVFDSWADVDETTNHVPCVYSEK